MASRKSGKKTDTKFKPGPDARRGRGPAKGAPNAGRPPNEWNAVIERLGDRWLVALEASAVVDDAEHPLFEKVGKWLVEQVRGKAKQQMDVTSNGESLTEILAAIAARQHNA